jgi:hypothetical protein
VSPVTWLFCTRVAAHGLQDAALTPKRGNRVDTYIALWFLVLLGAALLASRAGPVLATIMAALVAWRVVDIIQASANVALFDHFRVQHTHIVSDVTRSVVLALWNYAELALAFGVLYALNDHWFAGSAPFNAYYFSAVTQLTIGYGDIAPLGLGRACAVAQGACGLFLLAIMLARFLTLMPRITSGDYGPHRDSS